MFFNLTNLSERSKPAKHLALAIALATGSVVAMSGVIADPAHAQKKKKKGKKQYSETFIAAYNPINEALQVEGADLSAVTAQIAGLVAVSVSPDERYVTGSTIYSVGLKTSNQQLQFDGMKMMIESGQIASESLGQHNFIAFQLARALGQHASSRPFLQQAINNNFSTSTIDGSALQLEMSETYFREDRHKEGLASLKSVIEAREAAGLPVDEAWYRRGLSVGFINDIQPEVYDFVNAWIAAHPSTGNWRDAINITRQLNEYSAGETLDVLRLGFKLDTLKEKVEYIDYVEAADPRRLPKEVETVIQNGYSTGRASRDDIFLADSLQTASGRIRADRAELPALERDARAGSAGIRTVLAAGDAFLSYGENAKAEEFYSKAIAMPGVNAAQTLTRLGIAQVGLGKHAEAKASFAKVQGSRAAIAMLWSTYADQMAVPAPTPAVTAPAPLASPAS